MVRSLAVSSRLKAQRVIQEDLSLATLAGTLFRTAVNVRTVFYTASFY
jgi:hypothetical protein